MSKDLIISSVLSSERDEHSYLNPPGGGIYTFLNPVSYLEARKREPLFLQFDGIFVDGSLLAKAIRLLYGRKVTRRSFDMTSMGSEVFSYAEEKGKSIYIVSSGQSQVERAIASIRERYPNLMIAGYRNGYFSDEHEMDEAVHSIVPLHPDYLIVGMGIIKQEEFLLRAKEAGYRGIGFTCGGFISQIAQNNIDYYPAWVDRMNVRFLYRMYKEPHTRKRYLKAGILFPILFTKERIFS